MGYREAKELARIRSELRNRLMSQHTKGAWDLLARLRMASEGDDELRSEYERWRLRFELMAASA